MEMGEGAQGDMRVLRRAAIGAVAVSSVAGCLVIATALGAAAQPSSATPFLNHFHRIKTVASTVPGNGDVNPYGVAVVRRSTGRLRAGDVLVSNFNNRKNQQGTGSTIVEISPRGAVTRFARINPSTVAVPCPGGMGLTTALVVLRSGWVIVGSLPTVAGNVNTASSGCLIVLDSRGHVRESFSGRGINGPWDMTALNGPNFADLFVTNVLNGTVKAGGKVVHRGTVLRLALRLRGSRPPLLARVTKIGSGFAERTDPAALVVGPTGVGLSHGTLYVADTVNSRIQGIPFAVSRRFSAGTGFNLTRRGALNGPLGLTIAPGGDILTVNAGNGKIVETTPRGLQVAVKTLNNTPTPPGQPGNGALFGLAIKPHFGGVYFVDDDMNTLRLLH